MPLREVDFPQRLLDDLAVRRGAPAREELEDADVHHGPHVVIPLPRNVRERFSMSLRASRFIWYLSLDQLGQQRQRFLPAQIASLARDRGGDSFLGDVQFGSAEHLLQYDRGLHFSRQVRVIEFVRVADALVRRKLDIGAAERVAFAGAEVSERHLVRSADLSLQVMNLAREPVRWKPLGHSIGIEERSINSLRCRPEHSMESDVVHIVCWHRIPLLPVTAAYSVSV